MIKLPDYDISTTIHDGDGTLVYTGTRNIDSAEVVFKTLKPSDNLEWASARLKHEYSLLKGLTKPYLAKVIELAEFDHIPVFIMAFDHEFVSLKQWMPHKKNRSLAQDINITINLANALDDLHETGIQLKNIQPSNILINKNTLEIKFIDFGVASTAVTEKPIQSNLKRSKNAYAYTSPEQTGLKNHLVDYRTDLYSLGMVFFELITGRMPFYAEDDLGWIQHHVSNNPPPIIQVGNNEIPVIISDIVGKLLKKNADDRYQSALGLSKDLQKCLQRLEDATSKGDKGIEPFPIGLEERKGRFRIPQKLYGRENELKTLSTEFDKVLDGNVSLMLVNGPSGIGKSALIHEIRIPIADRSGFFIAGKHDQLRRSEPFIAISQAFEDWVNQALKLSSGIVLKWKQTLLKALGFNARALYSVVPNLELILGDQPELTPLDETGNQNRFMNTFIAFVQAIAKKEHPLVLFLDDMQWVDSPTLEIFKNLLCDPMIEHLMVIAAYRDNEVTFGHPFLMTLKDIEDNGQSPAVLTLKPLTDKHIFDLTSDTLQSNDESTNALAKLLHRKTEGSPFFVSEFLKMLHYKKLLYFNFEDNEWCWNIDTIDREGPNDCILDLMTDKMLG